MAGSLFMSKVVWVVHGPNLNLLGMREPGIYGSTTLGQIDAGLISRGQDRATHVETYQSNHEGALVDRIQAACEAGVGFIILNPAAYTHTSVALRDALAAVAIPFIEVHLSNIYRREAFRHHSYFSDLADGVIAGLGPAGYRLALDHAIDALEHA